MISSVRGFARRHRRKLGVVAFVAGGAYLGYRFLRSKLLEISQRASDESSAKENLQRRFEQNQSDCSMAASSLVPELCNNINRELQVEAITHQIQQLRGSSSHISQDSISTEADPAQQSRASKSKLELWNELKIMSITRTLTCLYSLCLLILLVRTQLNLVGRQNYVASVLAQIRQASSDTIQLHDETDTPQTDPGFECNRQFLSFSWWLINHGWVQVRERVQAAVDDVFARISPKDEMSAAQFRLLISRVRNRIEMSAQPTVPFKWTDMYLPPRDKESVVLDYFSTHSQHGPAGISDELRKLLDETSDLLESPDALLCLSKMMDAAINLLMQQKLSSVFEKGDSRLANILAKVSGQALIVPITDSSIEPSQRYFDTVESIDEVNAFSAVVYCGFDLDEIIPDE